jgi:cell division septum initiation protein DivIVA
VADRTKGRVRGLLGGGSPVEEALLEETLDRPGPDAQRALQVLTLAQRTADEHIAAAQHQADSIRSSARGAADQIARDAQAHAEGVRREAAKVLSDARGMAEQIVRDAQNHSDNTRRDSEKVLSDARAQSQEIVKGAQETAAGLERDAQQRYDEVVGSLATKRDVLQQQLDGLQQFDRDYRARLRKFMQSQLQALGGEEPTPTHVEVPQPTPMTAPNGPVNQEPAVSY